MAINPSEPLRPQLERLEHKIERSLGEVCAAPSVNEAAASSATPVAVPPARPSTERRSSGSSRLAARKSAICPQVGGTGRSSASAIFLHASAGSSSPDS